MAATQIREDNFLTFWWDEKTRIVGIDWKETTATRTDEEFKTELTLFAGHVEKHKPRGILVDVSRFAHKMAPEMQQWRVKNISSRYNGAGVKRYNGAGVKRFAFLFPKGADIPPMMNPSSAGEVFHTRAFTDLDEAESWLTVVQARTRQTELRCTRSRLAPDFAIS